MKDICCHEMTDYGPCPYVTNVERLAVENRNFRTAIWTGCHLQMTVMSIPSCMWHNVCNMGRCPLKLSVIYAPSQHT